MKTIYLLHLISAEEGFVKVPCFHEDCADTSTFNYEHTLKGPKFFQLPNLMLIRQFLSLRQANASKPLL